MIRRAINTLCSLLILVLYAAPVYAQAPSPYKVEELPFNTDSYNEISPVILNGDLVYCSDRRYSGFMDRTSFDGSRLYNQYLVRLADSTWGEPVLLKSERSYLFTNGPASIAGDGQTIYFTSDVETGKAAQKSTFRNKQGIFKAEINGNEIVSIEPFKYNSLTYNLMHPSLSSDGKRLCFSSDMKGTLGRSDIYYSDLVDGEWSDPVNIGSPVNSPNRENFPFIHESGKLYFASNRPGGTGQLDIYVTEFRDGAWVMPYHIPEPVNSRYDDFSLVASSDRKNGYFSSRRNRSSDDIFSFSSDIIRKSECNELRENIYWMHFIETRAVLNDSIPFIFEWNFGDGEKDQGPDVYHLYPGPGKYVVRLDLINLITNEVMPDAKIDTVVLEDKVQAYITSADTVMTGQSFNLSAEKTYLPGWDIDRYYWNFDNEEVATGERVSAQYLNPGNYDVQLIVTSKPDSEGKVSETCVTKKITVLRRP